MIKHAMHWKINLYNLRKPFVAIRKQVYVVVSRWHIVTSAVNFSRKSRWVLTRCVIEEIEQVSIVIDDWQWEEARVATEPQYSGQNSLVYDDYRPHGRVSLHQKAC